MVLRLNIKEVDMKRFNLGFKYFGFPEQCRTGKYCLVSEALALKAEKDSLEASIWELEHFTIPCIKTHYRFRIVILVALLTFSIAKQVMG